MDVEPGKICRFMLTDRDGEPVFECEDPATVWIGASCDSGHQIPASFCDRHAKELIQYYEPDSDQIMYCDLCYSESDGSYVFTQIDDVLGIGGVTPDKLAVYSFPRSWENETP